MEAVLLDIDGVIFQGDEVILGAPETVAWFRGHGIPYLFVTNTSSIPRSGLVERLAGAGIATDESRILTPVVAAVRWLTSHVEGPIALFVTEATKSEFAKFPILDERSDSGASAVVIGDVGTGWDFRTLNRAFRLLMTEDRPPLLALGMTRYWRARDGLQLDVAPFVVALEHAVGTKAVVTGKPAREFFETALDILGREPGETVMVGDDIRGDVGAAMDSGLPAVQVRTGKFRPRDLQQGITPTAVIDSVANLPDWWQQF